MGHCSRKSDMDRETETGRDRERDRERQGERQRVARAHARVTHEQQFPGDLVCVCEHRGCGVTVRIAGGCAHVTLSVVRVISAGSRVVGRYGSAMYRSIQDTASCTT